MTLRAAQTWMDGAPASRMQESLRSAPAEDSGGRHGPQGLRAPNCQLAGHPASTRSQSRQGKTYCGSATSRDLPRQALGAQRGCTLRSGFIPASLAPSHADK